MKSSGISISSDAAQRLKTLSGCILGSTVIGILLGFIINYAFG